MKPPFREATSEEGKGQTEKSRERETKDKHLDIQIAYFVLKYYFII